MFIKKLFKWLFEIIKTPNTMGEVSLSIHQRRITYYISNLLYL